MRAAFVSVGTSAFVASLAVLSLAGCKSGGARCDTGATACAPPPVCAAPPPSAPCAPRSETAIVLPGDTLHGHLRGDQGCECFSFDGVEYTLLDFKLASDQGGQPAPRIEIVGPDGKALALADCLQPEGSSVFSAEGIVLPKTGKYGVTVCKSKCDPAAYYTFAYDVRAVAPAEQAMHLTPCSKEKVSFTVPRGSRCMVTVRPKGRCGAEPKFVSVTDPMGGRALNPAAVLEGAPLPEVKHDSMGAATLDFNASQPGRYTVTLASEAGTEGDVTTIVQLFTPRPLDRSLYHSNASCNAPVAINR